jgi:hypothetical protein
MQDKQTVTSSALHFTQSKGHSTQDPSVEIAYPYEHDVQIVLFEQ